VQLLEYGDSVGVPANFKRLQWSTKVSNRLSMGIANEPAKKNPEKAGSIASLAASEVQAGRCFRILVVEDERKVGGAIQEGLERNSSYSVTVTHSGEDGFFLANSEHFDLLVLDVMLPGRTGVEVLSGETCGFRLRSARRRPKTPRWSRRCCRSLATPSRL